MGTYNTSLFPTGTSKRSTVATIMENFGYSFPGHLLPSGGVAGLVAAFQFFGTAISMKHHTLGEGASYVVVIDEGEAGEVTTTITGNSTSKTTPTTKVWGTGLSDAWHTCRVKAFNANDPNTNGYTVFNNHDLNAEGSGGDVGLTITYGTLPGGVTVPIRHIPGWGSTSTLAQLASDFGASADVMQGSSISGEYAKGVAFKGTGSSMTVRVLGTPGNLLLYRCDANGSITVDSPTPYLPTEVSEADTVDSDGFVTLTFSTTLNAHYRLAIGFSSFSNINWSSDSVPSGTFTYQNPVFGLTLAGNSTVAAGYTGVTPDYARSTTMYYWVMSGAKTRGKAISGSLASALTSTGSYSVGTGMLNGIRLPDLLTTETDNLFFADWINDCNSHFGFSSSYSVANPATTRTMSATTLKDDISAAIDDIQAALPDLRVFQAVSYWSVSAGTDYTAAQSAIETMIDAREAANELVYAVHQNTFDTGAAPVVLDSNIHPIDGPTGAGRHAGKIYAALSGVISPVEITSLSIREGTSRTIYGGATLQLHADVVGTGTGYDIVTWGATGDVSVDASGLVTAEEVGQTAKTGTVTATGADGTTTDSITINIPAAGAGGGGGGGDEMSISQTSSLTLLSAEGWTEVADVAGKTVKLVPRNGGIEFFVGTAEPSTSDMGESIEPEQFRPGYDPRPFDVDASSALYVKAMSSSVQVIIHTSA